MTATQKTQTAEPTQKRITISMLGKRFDKASIQETLIGNFGGVRYKDAYSLQVPHGECWLFDYGILVCWDVTESDRQKLCYDLEAIIEESVTFVSMEQYAWIVQEDMPLSIHHDVVVLPNNEPLTRLALSHAFAQSAKLIYFEDQAQDVIQENAYIARKLAQTGKVPLSRTALAKLRGSLFETSSDITLHFGLLDTPEFFWDYPQLEEVYQKLAKYLDLQPRIDILDKKLTNIQNMLDMLAAEQYHKHSSFLEWVIIVLIAVDIMVYAL